MTATDPSIDYIAGLDLGQQSDYTALAIARRRTEIIADKPVRHYEFVYVHRWQVKTLYDQIVDDVAKLYSREPVLRESDLVIDATGVGRPVTDMVRKAKREGRLPAKIQAVTITSGNKVMRENREYRVPKKDLVGILQILLGFRRLKIVPKLELADTIVKEFQRFKVKVKATTGTESFEAWRERDHDDLVLAVALACWFGERGKVKLDVGWLTKPLF